MINTADYITKFDRSGVSPSINELFTPTFEYSNSNEILVYMKSGSTYTQMKSGVDYEVLETQIRWYGSPSVCDEIRIQRNVQYIQASSQDLTTADNIEESMDRMVQAGQQQLQYDTLDPQHLDADGDRISNVATRADTGGIGGDLVYAVTKAQVDAAFGTDTPGTLPWGIEASDVGKYANATTDVSSGLDWQSFNGTPDPKGQHGKYLTDNGWVEFGVIPAAGSANQVLKDVDGVPTFTTVNTFPASGSFGQILDRNNAPNPDVARWRNSGYVPTPLSGNFGSVIKAKSDESRNEWKGKFFLTKHDVEFDNNLGISGLGEWGGAGLRSLSTIPQHRIWVGTISHTYGTPDFVYCSVGMVKHVHNVVYHPTTGYKFKSKGIPVPYEINVISNGNNSLELAACSLKHCWTENAYVTEAGVDEGDANIHASGAGPGHGNLWPSITTVTDNALDPNIVLPVTVLWYFEG